MTRTELLNIPVSELMHGDYDDEELYHVGVKGMKWGVRKARPVATGAGRRGGQGSSSSSSSTTANDAARKAARKKKAVRAAKIGAAVAGTALAAYGAYKLSRYSKNKKAMANMRAMKEHEWTNMQRRGDSAEAQKAMLRSYNDKLADMYRNRWK